MCRAERFSRLDRFPVGFYADHPGQGGRDRWMIPAAVQGHGDPSRNASAETDASSYSPRRPVPACPQDRRTFESFSLDKEAALTEIHP